jgi:hypothetical protein
MTVHVRVRAFCCYVRSECIDCGKVSSLECTPTTYRKKGTVCADGLKPLYWIHSLICGSTWLSLVELELHIESHVTLCFVWGLCSSDHIAAFAAACCVPMHSQIIGEWQSSQAHALLTVHGL